MPADLLAELLARIRAVCRSERGRQAELARELGVHPVMLNAWLAGRQEPRGSAVLRMQEWLRKQEA